MMLMLMLLLSAFFFCHVMLADNAIERSLFVTFLALSIFLCILSFWYYASSTLS